MGENSKITAKPRGKPFKKGESGNENGRPKGRKNFATLYREAIEKIAATTGKEPDEFELEIVEQALRKARNGDISFYKDTMDRLHGKPHQTIGGKDGEAIHITFDGSFEK